MVSSAASGYYTNTNQLQTKNAAAHSVNCCTKAHEGHFDLLHHLKDSPSTFFILVLSKGFPVIVKPKAARGNRSQRIATQES